MKTNVRAGVDAAKNGDGADKEEDNREEEEEEELVKENARRRAALETTVAKFTDDAVPSMTVREVLNVINNQEESAKRTVLFLDCREKEERAVSIIPGASSAEEFEDDFEKQQDDGKETIVVCYCTIGYRSQKKVQELSKRLARSRPDVKAYNLSGSIVAWTHETDAPKLLDPKTGKETNRVHTYGKTWALQSVEYESVVYKRPVFEAVKGFFFKKKKK